MTNPPESPHGPADSTPPEQHRPTEPLPPYDGTEPTEKLPPYDGTQPTEKLPPYDGTRPTEPLPPYDATQQPQPPFPPPPIPPYDAGHPAPYSQPPAYATTQYPQPQYPQPQFGQQQYGQHPQPPLNAAQFYPQDQPYGYAPLGPTPPRRGNGPGLAALILGIVAILTAFVPVLNFIAFFLGVAGVIVGIVGLVIANRERRTAAWGTALSALSLVLATVMVVIYSFGFLFAVSDAVEEVVPNLPQPTDIVDPPSPVPSDAVADVHPLGTVVELTDETGEPVYEATVSASVLDATQEVSAIELNPDAPAGMQWAMITIELTSVADSSLSPAFDVMTEYVTPEGDSYTRLDAFALAPEPTLDALFNLEPGESGTGNVVIAIPTDDPASGVWALTYGHGFDGGEWFYFAVE